VGVVQGVAAHEELTLTIGLTAGLGLVLAVGIWWLYFDLIAHQTIEIKRLDVFTSAYDTGHWSTWRYDFLYC